jgi:hypothetical protein
MDIPTPAVIFLSFASFVGGWFANDALDQRSASPPTNTTAPHSPVPSPDTTQQIGGSNSPEIKRDNTGEGHLKKHEGTDRKRVFAEFRFEPDVSGSLHVQSSATCAAIGIYDLNGEYAGAIILNVIPKNDGSVSIAVSDRHEKARFIDVHPFEGIHFDDSMTPEEVEKELKHALGPEILKAARFLEDQMKDLHTAYPYYNEGSVLRAIERGDMTFSSNLILGAMSNLGIKLKKVEGILSGVFSSHIPDPGASTFVPATQPPPEPGF